ncbi:TPA: type IV pilus biogenesis protein PilP [Yersinia enterocolitica]|nr:type IV pilus biogenesis protein PilP [Yersinia enterocolitica]
MLLNKTYFVIPFVVFLLCSVNAFADNEKPILIDKLNSDELNIGLMESIQGNTVITEAKLINARAQAELQKVGSVGVSIPLNTAMPLQPAESNKDGKAINSAQSLPQIIEISGAGKNLSAKLVTSNGNYLSVVNGTQIAGSDYIVKELTMTNVLVSDSKNNLYNLPFSG